MSFNFNQIHGGLYQGNRPPAGPELQRRGFGLLVLCAMEHQPGPEDFPGVQVVHAPNDDDFSRSPTRDELRTAIQAARLAVPVLQGGGKVLSTCWMGHNRSGLVSALTLHLWLGVDGPTAIRMIKRNRRGALRNPGFLACLNRLSAPEKP